MDDTFTFTTEMHQFTIHNNFFKKEWFWGEELICRTAIYDLMSKHNMKKYLHNTMGPAIIYPTGSVAYFNMGRALTEDEIKNVKFQQKFIEELK